jgi:hypothetical protein
MFTFYIEKLIWDMTIWQLKYLAELAQPKIVESRAQRNARRAKEEALHQWRGALLDIYQRERLKQGGVLWAKKKWKSFSNSRKSF